MSRNDDSRTKTRSLCRPSSKVVVKKKKYDVNEEDDHLEFILDVDELALHILGPFVRPDGLSLHGSQFPREGLVLVLRLSQGVLGVLQLGLQAVVVLALLGADLENTWLV